MSVLLIDNYDSFTYNLVHYLQDLGAEVEVRRNDKVELEEIEKADKILLSPGPGIPDEAGRLKEIIREFADSKSILGICLGQQAIAEVFGGRLLNLNKVYHGVATRIQRTNEDEVLYKGLPEELEVGRYHSWVVDPDLPEELVETSKDHEGEVMSLRHISLDVRAVQYHPESILTEHGKKMLENWLDN